MYVVQVTSEYFRSAMAAKLFYRSLFVSQYSPVTDKGNANVAQYELRGNGLPACI